MSKGADIVKEMLWSPNLTPSRSLKRELVRAQEEIKRIQSVPLVIGQFMEAIDQKYVSLPWRNLSILTILTAPVLCNLAPAPTMLYEFSLPSTVRS